MDIEVLDDHAAGHAGGSELGIHDQGAAVWRDWLELFGGATQVTEFNVFGFIGQG